MTLFEKAKCYKSSFPSIWSCPCPGHGDLKLRQVVSTLHWNGDQNEIEKIGLLSTPQGPTKDAIEPQLAEI
jgi:hypothetical protein